MPKRKPIAILTADLHLGHRGRWVNRPDLRGDAEESFRQICQYAVDHEIKCIIAAGDLLDVSKPDSATIQFLHGEMDRLKDREINFYFVQGNHEKVKPAWFETHPWPTHVDDDWFYLPGKSRAKNWVVYGLDARRGDDLAEAIAKLETDVAAEGMPKCDLLVVHQMWTELCATGSSISDGSLSMIPHADYVLTGDVHIHREFTAVGQDGRTITAWSPGSTSMRSIDEEPDKKFFVLMDDMTVQSVDLQTRPFHEFPTIYTPEELEACRKAAVKWVKQARQTAKELAEDIRKPIIRFSVTQEMVEEHDAIAILREKFEKHAHLFFREIKPKAKELEVDADRRRELRDRGLVGCLPLVVQEDSSQHRDLKALLDTQDRDKAEEVLMGIRGRFLEG